MDVSVIDATDVDAEDLLHQSAIPNDWRMALEAQGYVIQEERQYVTVTLADGRQGITPVSNVVVKHHSDMFQ